MKSLAEAPTTKNEICRESATFFTILRVSTACWSILPDKSNNMLLIDHLCCINISLVSSCQEICINKDWMYQVFILPHLSYLPKSFKYFNIACWIFPQF